MKKNNKNTVLSYVLIFCFFLVVVFMFNNAGGKVNKLTYDEFMKNLNEGNVTELVVVPKPNSALYEMTGKLKGYKEKETFNIVMPYSDNLVSNMMTIANDHNLKVTVKRDPENSSVLRVIANLLPIVLIIGFSAYFLTRQVGGANKSFDFGKSKAKLSSDKNKVTFKDVAGLVEEKYEVKELIDFLKEPKKFQKLGARIPKGVLLVGPPGTGKTLLARAVAGEANVPFYYISGSDFVELFVGVGASRVRDMFKQAKQTAPCLIFIDEIDAVGRQRGTGLGGGHDEREQTLNQLLTEMDGFGENEGIIIIAATNRPDVLDPALLRPGRFDRQVTINLPDIKGREEILEVHAKNKVFAKSVSLKNIAKRTVGFSGADLENLLNEAALLAVRRDKNEITMSEMDEAHDRVLMGPAKQSHKYTEKEKRIVAYHEAGHAVVGIKLEGANEVQKITIVPRGHAGGYNLMLPREETYLSTKKELLESISGLLGGRVSEELVFGEMTTGAHNDFQQATKIARAMVTEYGMSSLGPLQLETQEGSVFLGRDYNKSRNFSGQVAYEIDQEMREIIDGCYKQATKIIKENRKLLDSIASALLENETITKEQIDYIVEHGTLPKGDYDSFDESKSLEEMSLVELKELAKEKGIKGYSKMSKDELKEALSKED